MTDRSIAWAALLTIVFWGVVALLIYIVAYGCMGIDGPCPADSQVRNEVMRIIICATPIYVGGVFAFRRLFSN